MILFIFCTLIATALALSGTVTDTINVEGLPYAPRHNGLYVVSGIYNGLPVYKSKKNGGWVMYKRSTQSKWKYIETIIHAEFYSIFHNGESRSFPEYIAARVDRPNFASKPTL